MPVTSSVDQTREFTLTTFIETMSVKMASGFISSHKFEPLRKFVEFVVVKNDIILFKCKTKKWRAITTYTRAQFNEGAKGSVDRGQKAQSPSVD